MTMDPEARLHLFRRQSQARPWVGFALMAMTACAGGTKEGGAPGTGGNPGPAGSRGTGGIMQTRTGGAGGAIGSGGSGVDAAAADSRGPITDAAAVESGASADDAAAPASGDGGGAALPGWTLVWADEFDQDGAPDVANWRYESGFVRNMELQWYQAANAMVANGVLTIEGRRERVTNPSYLAGSGDWRRGRAFAEYTSTSMTTAGKRTFTYGRFEARARIDVRQGSWPAFWTLGTTGGWPAGGEVDIMEFYAGRVLANVCRPMGSTCGWSSVTRPVSSLGATWSGQFHVWAMEWDAARIDLYLDGALMNHFNVADAVGAGATNPYVARPVYLLLNLALGGTNGGDPTNTVFPMKYEVDYVRVYQRTP